MAIADTPTVLALDRYAEIMGIPPLAFSGGTSDIIFQPGGSSCNSVWYQYAWQYADQVGREDLAHAIRSAEEDIARHLGYWPAPVWIENEPHDYPRYHRRDMYRTNMRNVRGQYNSVDLSWGKFIQGGQRTSTLLDTVAVAFSDEDGDTFPETVTVTLAGIDTTIPACEIKVYFVGSNGSITREIRPARTITFTGGVFTATFWKWQLFDPDLLYMIPTTDFGAIDADVGASYVANVEVRRTYNDYTASHGEIYWEQQPATCTCVICGGSGCPTCNFTSQTVCIASRNTELGMVLVSPSSYDSTDARWETVAMSVCRDPDKVQLNYYAGERSNDYMAGATCDPLDRYLAETIAWLATARLERSYCQCGATTALAEWLRTDLAITSAGDTSRFTPESQLENPFGTLRGEIKAWERISHIMNSTVTGVSL